MRKSMFGELETFKRFFLRHYKNFKYTKITQKSIIKLKEIFVKAFVESLETFKRFLKTLLKFRLLITKYTQEKNHARSFRISILLFHFSTTFNDLIQRIKNILNYALIFFLIMFNNFYYST